MQGSSVESANALERGFENDRRYMLIDKEGTFISQRTHPELVFFYPQVSQESLTISYKNKSFKIPLNSILQNTIATTIFDKPVPATEVSNEANSWFSTIMNQDIRLVKMGEKNIRHKNLIKGPDQVEVSFADGYPYLIIGTASLKNLNSKLAQELGFERFRPNIVLETHDPHIEDTWDDVKIGEGQFLVVKSCARCPVVTVDQVNGIKSKEPLKTLASFRKKENSIYFGANAISRKVSSIRVSDEVTIL